MKYYHDVEEKVAKEYGFKNIDDIVSLGFEKHTGEYELIRDFIYDLCLEAQRECRKQTLAYIDEKIKNTPAMGSNFSAHNNSDNFLLK